MYSPAMYYPKRFDVRRVNMGLSIAVLTLGGILSFGMGQALGHWHAPTAAPAHRPATTTQQAIASGALSQQVASGFHPVTISASRPTPTLAGEHEHHKGDAHHKDGNGQADGHDAPSPKAGSTTAGGDNGGE